MFATDFTAETKKMSWKQFRRKFCPPEYIAKCAEWEKCADAFTGEEAIRAKAEKYLYRPESKGKAKAWEAYRDRAKFPSFCKDTLLKMNGILSSSDPVLEVPEELEFFREWATADHGGIVALKNRVQENILKFGRCHLLLQVGDPEEGQNLFFVESFAPEKFLNCDWETERGETYLSWVLLDASDIVFDKKTKKRDFDRKLLVLGLDANGEYYQAKIKPEEWEVFDLDHPNRGELEYPAPYGARSRRIPFFVFNVTDRSFGHYQPPPMIDLIDLSLHLYNADAPYQQTQFLPSEPTLVRKGMGKAAPDPKLGSDVFNDIPTEADMFYLEFSGAGAAAQLDNINAMKADAEKMGVSIAGIEGAIHSSGVALEIVRNAQTAALRIINANIGKGIETLIRFAYQWRHPEAKTEEQDAIRFTPSDDFAEIKAVAAEIIAFAKSRRDLQMTREEMRLWVEKNAALEHRDWDELAAELDAEEVNEESAGFAGMDLNRLAGRRREEREE